MFRLIAPLPFTAGARAGLCRNQFPFETQNGGGGDKKKGASTTRSVHHYVAPSNLIRRRRRERSTKTLPETRNLNTKCNQKNNQKNKELETQ